MIRKATIQDSANIAALSIQVWLDTYATEGIRSALSRYVLTEYTEDNLMRKMENHENVFLLFEENDHLLGFAAINWAAKCPLSGDPLPELVQLYVQERAAGKGIGSRLLEASFRFCREKGYPAIWLTAKSDNERALNFYSRRGFIKEGSVFFTLEEEKHENYLLKRTLV